MPNSLKNDIVLVRYPFSDLSGAKVRPAVVVSAPQSPNFFATLRWVLPVLAICAASIALGQSSRQAASISQADIVGIWKLCYEPGLKKVSEVDGGYLILLPDGTFHRLTNDYSFQGLESVETGTYEIRGGQAVFRPKDWRSRDDSTSKNYRRESAPSYKEFALTYQPGVEVVLFDDLKRRIKRPVLRWQELDYSYARVY